MSEISDRVSVHRHCNLSGPSPFVVLNLYPFNNQKHSSLLFPSSSFIMYIKIQYLWTACFVASTVGQSFPPKPTGLTTLNSKLVPGASISFRKVRIYEPLQP